MRTIVHCSTKEETNGYIDQKRSKEKVDNKGR